MSQENVEIVLRFHGALNARDMQTVYDLLDPEVVWVTNLAGPDKRTFHGHTGFRQLQGLFEETLEDVSLDAEEFIDVGNRVVTCGHMRAQGASSGAKIETARSWLWTIRDGVIVRHQTFAERSQALEAAGLRE